MVGRKTSLKLRKIHRYLGLFLGIQFLMWTISGLYFSWTSIDDIHGDQFLNEDQKPPQFTNLVSPNKLQEDIKVESLELRIIADRAYYWINGEILMDARTGAVQHGINEEQALAVASQHILPDFTVQSVERLTETGKHHEYRGRPLPAYVITYDSDEHLKAYVSMADGSFQRVRHRAWRWFDFLWMTHTMDYEGRDNFNTIVLRIFSLMGLITVLSGFVLWYVSSPTIRKLTK
jgi:uncharacterized iron-regulated membrane protein